jgi:hypothetical protein
MWFYFGPFAGSFIFMQLLIKALLTDAGSATGTW